MTWDQIANPSPTAGLILVPPEVLEAEGLRVLGDVADRVVGEAVGSRMLCLDLEGDLETDVRLLSEPVDDLVDDLRELGDGSPGIAEAHLTVEAPDAPDGSGAMEWLDALAETWQKADLVEEKPDVIHAAHERIVIEWPGFVGLRLAPAAYRHGLGARASRCCYGAPDRIQARGCHEYSHSD